MCIVIVVWDFFYSKVHAYLTKETGSSYAIDNSLVFTTISRNVNYFSVFCFSYVVWTAG